MNQRGRGEHIPDERRQLMTGVAALVRDGEQPERMARTADNNPPHKQYVADDAREGRLLALMPGMSSVVGEEVSVCYQREYHISGKTHSAMSLQQRSHSQKRQRSGMDAPGYSGWLCILQALCVQKREERSQNRGDKRKEGYHITRPELTAGVASARSAWHVSADRSFGVSQPRITGLMIS